MNQALSSHTRNPAIYYIEEKGWLSSSLKPVSREHFLAHQAKKAASVSCVTSINGLIKMIAVGVFGMAQLMRSSIPSLSMKTHLALPVLTMHAWSQIPTASAHMSPVMKLADDTLPARGTSSEVCRYTSWYEDRGLKLSHCAPLDILQGRYEGAEEFTVNTYNVDPRSIPMLTKHANGDLMITRTVYQRDIAFDGESYANTDFEIPSEIQRELETTPGAVRVF